MAARRLELTGFSPLINGLRWLSEDRLRIGRDANLEIVIHEPSLERKHAEIRGTSKGWVVQDFSGGSGTQLNGVPVGKLAKKLQIQDVIQCGRHTFKVTALEWQAPEAPATQSQDIRTSGPIVQLQAFSQLSWEQGLRGLSQEDSPLPHAKQFLTLLRAGYHLSQIDSVNELLQTLLDDTVAVLNAHRGAILLVDNTSGPLALKCFSGPQAAGARGYSSTLAQRCFNKGESLLCCDHQADSPSSGKAALGSMSSIICALLRSPRRRLGVLHLDRGPRQAPFSQDDFKLADAVAATVSVGIESAVAIDKQRGQFLQEVLALASQVMGMRDGSNSRHCQRVAHIALLIADELRLPDSEKQELRLGALLHDVGKVGVPDDVVRKRSKLEASEERELRKHPLHGVTIAEKISAFAPALPIIRSHHECWDGSGYPDGLSADQIPRAARIVAVANAVDHMNELHPGRQNMLGEETLSGCERLAGTVLDPHIVASLRRVGAAINQSICMAEPLLLG